MKCKTLLPWRVYDTSAAPSTHRKLSPEHVTKITTHSNRLYYLHIATSQTQPKHIYFAPLTCPQEAEQGAQH